MLGMLQTVVQPESVIHAINPIAWYDARYVSDTFTSGSNLIINSVASRSGRGPTLKVEDNSKKPALGFDEVRSPCIMFDGVNDILTGSALNMTHTQVVTTFAKYSVNATNFYQTLYQRGVDWTGTAGGTQIYARNSPTAPFGSDIYLGTRGSTAALSITRATGPYGYNVVNTLSTKVDFSKASAYESVRLYVSGVIPAGYVTSSDWATTTSDHGNAVIGLGNRLAAPTQVLNGNVFQFILIDRNLTDDQINYIEKNVIGAMW